MQPYRLYHKDDIYARMAIHEIDAYTDGAPSQAGDDARSDATDDDDDDVASVAPRSSLRKARPKQAFG